MSDSTQERNQYVDNFLSARQRGKAKIKSFNALASYLDDERIIQNPHKTFSYGIAESEAGNLFHRLVAIAKGALRTGDCTPQEAYDLLYAYIGVLIEHSQIQEDLLPPSQLALDFAKLEKRIDERDTEITNTLDLMVKWKKDWERNYLPKLKELKDYLSAKKNG